MECPKCHSLYQKEKNVPMLLIKCGHTLCDRCAGTAFDGKCITCPECGGKSQVASVSMLPKNMALLAMSLTQSSSPVHVQSPANAEPVCATHKKKLEAFCLDDRTLLCIDCILLDGHKAHDISPIAQASEKERAELQQEVDAASKLEENLNLMLADISNFRVELNDKANSKREKVTSVFKEITNVIHERESVLKQNISNILEKEEDVLNTTTGQIQEHLSSIATFKSDATHMRNEADCTLLEHSLDRSQKSAQANRPLPSVSFAVAFPDVKKENELTVLWKMLSPQSGKQPTSSLYATTASYASKRTERSKAFSKPHPDPHVASQRNSKDRKKQAEMVIDKMLSPRRDSAKTPSSQPSFLALNSSGLSSISNISIITSSGKSAAQNKEETKVAKLPITSSVEAPIAFPKAESEDDPNPVPQKGESSEATPEGEDAVLVTAVPTALITMPPSGPQTTPVTPAAALYLYCSIITKPIGTTAARQRRSLRQRHRKTLSRRPWKKRRSRFPSRRSLSPQLLP